MGVARILSGVHYFAKRNITHPAKTVQKIDSCSGWGCTSCPAGEGVHLHILPVN